MEIASSPTTPEIIATVLFAIAVLHTFVANQFQKLGSRFPEGSVGENFFHLLGEVEVVFGLWAALFLIGFALTVSPSSAVQYAESLNFTEPAFVFVIMTVAATRPLIELAKILIFAIAKLIPLRTHHKEIAVYFSCLTMGPLLGSFITEPAAMTVVALILKQRYFTEHTSSRLKYITIATLFVNVSIGGVLTPFAAPPVLMVAGKWNWDLAFMIQTFGIKAALATALNSALAAFLLAKEIISLKGLSLSTHNTEQPLTPVWVRALHVFFLTMIVLTAHHPIIFIGIFLFFMGVVVITAEYQNDLPLKQSLLVAFFLGGLVVLGGLQSWWLSPILQNLSESALFLGATALTAVTDNAALTYLGSQVEGISDAFKYSLVAGAITGGGLTVIANAPNPAGFSILQDRFGGNGIHPLKLFVAALAPTVIAALCLWPY